MLQQTGVIFNHNKIYVLNCRFILLRQRPGMHFSCKMKSISRCGSIVRVNVQAAVGQVVQLQTNVLVSRQHPNQFTILRPSSSLTRSVGTWRAECARTNSADLLSGRKTATPEQLTENTKKLLVMKGSNLWFLIFTS
jgi:hypothetical protein